MTLLVAAYIAFVFGSLGFCVGACWAMPERDDSPKCPDFIPEWMLHK